MWAGMSSTHTPRQRDMTFFVCLGHLIRHTIYRSIRQAFVYVLPVSQPRGLLRVVNEGYYWRGRRRFSS